MIIHSDAIEELQKMESNSIDCCFTSPNPPLFYEKQDYSIVGGENNTEEYILHLIVIFDQVKRVLKESGSLFVQMGDYYDPESMSLRLIPQTFEITMRNNGWCVRGDLAWHRTEKLKDTELDKTRFRNNKEFLFWFVKNPKQTYFNIYGHNYWRTSVHAYSYNYKSNVFDSGLPLDLIKLAIKTTVPLKTGIILDPMAGTGTVGVVAKELDRQYILIDINERMIKGMKERLGEV